MDINPAYAEAECFLSALDSTTNTFCFQIFDDLKSRHDRRLAATVRGTLKNRFEYLKWMNDQGAGIFVSVNAIKAGCARKVENLEHVRAVWQDDDNGFSSTYPFPPSIIVRSSPGKYQRYWLTDRIEPELHQAIMERLIRDYGSDPGAKDLVRVLRLPGFVHMKDPEKPFRVELVSAPGWIYSSDQLAEAFPPIWREPEKPKPFDGSAFNENEFGRLIEALAYISADDYPTWVRVGMALRREYGDDGRSIWDGWAATSPHKFNSEDQAKTWQSFKRDSGVTLGTVFYLARCNGFRCGGRRYA